MIAVKIAELIEIQNTLRAVCLSDLNVSRPPRRKPIINKAILAMISKRSAKIDGIIFKKSLPMSTPNNNNKDTLGKKVRWPNALVNRPSNKIPPIVIKKPDEECIVSWPEKDLFFLCFWCLL